MKKDNPQFLQMII